jgi:predicted enzyme related to lactoylglutathione lyase
MPGVDYTLFHVYGASPNGIAGAMAPPMEGMPAFSGVYLMIEDAAATVARTGELAATALMEPASMPGVGTLATLRAYRGPCSR